MIPAIALSVLLLLAAAALRAGGTALTRIPRADAVHDAAEGRAGARTVARLLERSDRVQPAVGVVQSSLLVAAVLPAAWVLAVNLGGWALFGALLLLVVVVVLVGDVLPRWLGRRRPRFIAYHLAVPLRIAATAGRPAAGLAAENGLVTESEPGEEDDEEDHGERQLISSVLEFSETVVREVMVPRADMVVIQLGASSDELLDLFVQHGYSRIPVIAGGTDDVAGICYAKDLLALIDRGGHPQLVDKLLRPADFVPETKRVADLLREMQATKSHIAIVVDEFGGTAGLVTLEDLLEELVGEIVDEYDVEEPMVEQEAAGTWLVDGRLPVADLSELVGTELPADEWDTVGGLVLGLAGRVPHVGETVTIDRTALTALRVQGRRVAQVRVHRLEKDELPTVDALS